MIPKGLSLETLSYRRICPLFTEDDARYRSLPQWASIEASLAPGFRRSEACQAWMRSELSRPSPDYALMASLQFVMSDDCLQELLQTLSEADADGEEPIGDQARIDSVWKRRLEQYISFNDWKILYRWIWKRLYIVSMEHPLHKYASKSLPMLTEDERSQVATQFHLSLPRTAVLGLMKQLQDLCPSYRLYGVVLDQPCPYLHSCLPTAILEWNSSGISVTALYDLDDPHDAAISRIPDLDHENVEERLRAVEARTGESCACWQCRSELDASSSTTTTDRLALARGYLAKGRLEQAEDLYDQVFKEQPDCLDAWHARGAIELSLGRKRFLEAQRLWANALAAYPEACSNHSGLAVQAEKLRAYHYLEQDSPIKEIGPLPSFQSLLPGVFCADTLDRPICQQLVDMAQAAGTWTKNRHYAVPTYDIPIHTIPSLLEWFHSWFQNSVRPLLAHQFNTSNRFYVHDAFVVQYQATESWNYLPLHTDESTHSFVVALNDCSDYSGGGTYFYEADLVYRAKIGQMVSFRGDQVLHGGEAVQRGTRYILAVFLYHDDDEVEPELDASDTESCPVKRALGKSNVGEVIRESKSQKLDFSFGFL